MIQTSEMELEYDLVRKASPLSTYRNIPHLTIRPRHRGEQRWKPILATQFPRNELRGPSK